MAFTYDPATDRGRVRLMIPDRRADEVIFQDREIDTFLAIEGDSIKRAAALALETIAADEALVQKVMTRLDLSTNGAATAKALMERAQKLRDQAEDEEVVGAFDWAEMVVDGHTETERLYKEMLRGG